MKTINSLIIIFFLPILLFAENPDTTITKIETQKSQIINASNLFNINPDYLAAIIYIERSVNFDWSDKALDVLIAKRGYNSSIGFCQVKLKTAYWIETQITDTLALYNPGKKYTPLLTLSRSPNELINKLKVDSLNISYAAAYLCIIQNYWSAKGFSLTKKPSILGTLYSIGMFNNDGSARKPHAHPKANWFGEKVKSSLTLFNTLINPE